MTLGVMLVVLFAALLHAVWNFLVKRSSDPYQGMCSVVLGHIPFALGAIIYNPVIHTSSLAYVICGAFLHTGYQFFLLNSYRFGELSQVYPVARGVAPLFVAVVSVSFLGVRYETFEIAALAIIGTGIMSFAYRGFRVRSERCYTSLILAVFTGAFIAAYSLVDGLGARKAGAALSYYSWVSIINAILFSVIVKRVRPGVIKASFLCYLPITLFGGAASYLAYALVVWAFTLAPIALVASLRDSSIIFAMLFGVFLLKERFDRFKVIATLVTLAGVALLRFGT